jgi:hypothetical protein
MHPPVMPSRIHAWNGLGGLDPGMDDLPAAMMVPPFARFGGRRFVRTAAAPGPEPVGVWDDADGVEVTTADQLFGTGGGG